MKRSKYILGLAQLGVNIEYLQDVIFLIGENCDLSELEKCKSVLAFNQIIEMYNTLPKLYKDNLLDERDMEIVQVHIDKLLKKLKWEKREFTDEELEYIENRKNECQREAEEFLENEKAKRDYKA